MRIIHTGDWHMNHRLNRIDMTPLLQDAIRQVAQHLENEKADVLIVAGDVFCGREGREQLQVSIRFLKETFKSFLGGGGTMLMISGNHDSEAFFETLRDAFDLVSPLQKGSDGAHAGGRVYVAVNPNVITLRDPHGQRVQFVLMPYPTPRAYLPGENVHYKNAAERNANMAGVFRDRLTAVVDNVVDKRYPAVLVSHAQVRGVSPNDLFQAGDEHDVIVEHGDLPTHFAYGAYGHIHRASSVGQGIDHFRYCGSLLPLDAGETEQAKSVLFVDIGPQGRVSSPRALPIHGPRLLVRDITPEQITGLREQYDDCDSVMLKYCLHYDPNVNSDPFPLHQQIREIFPRWYFSDVLPVRANVKPEDENSTASFTSGSLDIEDVSGTILHYLNNTAAWGDGEATQEEVIALARELLADDALMTQVKGVRA